MPSTRAAIIKIPASVETPVPPMPAMKILQISPLAGGGIGSVISSGKAGFTNVFAGVDWSLLSAFLTVTKLGQNPFRQDISLLHRLWSIWRFSPSGRIRGLTATQFDLTAQSPQPSQTASLIMIVSGLSAISPRLRLRRNSVAQP